MFPLQAKFRSFPRQQGGAVLVVALIFLMLLTILAVSASGSSLLQEKMVAATRNAQLAQWGAESALRGAEWRLWSATTRASTRMDCGASLATADCYTVDPMRRSRTVVDFKTATGWTDAGTNAGTIYQINYPTYSSGAASPRLATSPRYLIEDLGVELPPGSSGPSEYGSQQEEGYLSVSRHIYRITARSTGGNKNAVSLVQSTFAAKSF